MRIFETKYTPADEIDPAPLEVGNKGFYLCAVVDCEPDDMLEVYMQMMTLYEAAQLGHPAHFDIVLSKVKNDDVKNAFLQFVDHFKLQLADKGVNITVLNPDLVARDADGSDGNSHDFSEETQGQIIQKVKEFAERDYDVSFTNTAPSLAYYHALKALDRESTPDKPLVDFASVTGSYNLRDLKTKGEIEDLSCLTLTHLSLRVHEAYSVMETNMHKTAVEKFLAGHPAAKEAFTATEIGLMLSNCANLFYRHLLEKDYARLNGIFKEAGLETTIDAKASPADALAVAQSAFAEGQSLGKFDEKTTDSLNRCLKKLTNIAKDASTILLADAIVAADYIGHLRGEASIHTIAAKLSFVRDYVVAEKSADSHVFFGTGFALTEPGGNGSVTLENLLLGAMETNTELQTACLAGATDGTTDAPDA